MTQCFSRNNFTHIDLKFCICSQLKFEKLWTLYNMTDSV